MHGNVTHVHSHSHPAHSSRRQFIQLSITSSDRLSPSATATIHQDTKRHTCYPSPCASRLSDLFSFSFIPSFLSSPNYSVCGGGDFSIFNLLNALTQTLCVSVCLHTCCSLCTRVATDTLHTDELREKHVSGFNTLRVIDFLYTKRA